MTLRPHVLGTVLGMLSCAHFAASSETDGNGCVIEQRLRMSGMVGPGTIRTVPDTNGRRFAVSPSGNDANDCSEKSPCREIRRAITLATAPGDIVLVADGTYANFVADGLRGEPERPITVFATGNNAIVASDAACRKKRCRDTIVIRNSHHVVIDGLSAHHAPRAAVAIFYGDHIVIRNGRFDDNGRWGIFSSFADDVTVEHDEISRSHREHGVYLSNSGDRAIVRFNLLHDNDGCGIHLNGDYREKPELDRYGRSLYAGDVDGIISDVIIEGNLIYRNGSGSIANGKRRGGAGINLDGVWDSKVGNNILFGNSGTGIAAFGDADGLPDSSKEDGDGRFGPRGLVITHNTIVMPEGARHALQLRASRGTNTVTNNVLHHQDRRRAGLDFGTATDAILVTSNRNVLERVVIADRVRTLEVWKRDSGQDKQSFTIPANRLFVDMAHGDYALPAGALAGHLMPLQQRSDSVDKSALVDLHCPVGACVARR